MGMGREKNRTDRIRTNDLAISVLLNNYRKNALQQLNNCPPRQKGRTDIMDIAHLYPFQLLYLTFLHFYRFL